MQSNIKTNNTLKLKLVNENMLCSMRVRRRQHMRMRRRPLKDEMYRTCIDLIW